MKCRNYEVNIPRFYRQNSIDLILFGWVKGMQTSLPAMETNKAIQLFLDHFKISEDDYCFESAHNSYYRALNLMFDMERETKNKI